MAIVNPFNFLRWNDDAATPVAVPHAYWFDRERCNTMPIGYPTEVLAFYINTTDGVYTIAEITIDPATDLRLDLVKLNTGVVEVANIATLSSQEISPGAYNLYANVTLPALADGIYFFRIHYTSDNSVMLTSTHILVVNDKTKLDKETTYCKFRHDRFFYGIAYHDIPEFYQKFRLRISEVDYQPEAETEVYKEISTGKRRVYNNSIDAVAKMETYYFDKEAHQAAFVMVEHRELYMNEQRYRKKSVYRINTDVRSKLSKGEFEVYDDLMATLNNCDTTPVTGETEPDLEAIQLDTPTLDLSIIDDNTIVATWSDVANEDSYTLYRGTVNNIQFTSPVYSGSLLTYNNVDMLFGRTYHFFLVAEGSGDYRDSAPVHASITLGEDPNAQVTLNTPSFVLNTNGENAVIGTWLAVADALGYRLRLNITDDFGSSTEAYNGPLLTYEADGFTANTTVYGWLQALGNGSTLLSSGYATDNTTTAAASPVTTFDTILVPGSNIFDFGSEAGIFGKFGMGNDDEELHFNAVSTIGSFTGRMRLELAGVFAAYFDVPTAYLGMPWKFHHHNGTDYFGVFAHATIALS